MAVVTSQGSQTARKQSSRKASRKLPETGVTAVVFLPFFFFFFFFFFQARSLFSRPQGHEPPCSAIKATPPSNETKILSRTEIDSARRRKKKLKNQPSMAKPMIHGLNRRVRIWAAILHINPILFHVEDESTLL